MQKMRITGLVMLLACAVQAQQTQVDLSNQGKKVDFSGASATKPARLGPLPPTAACSTGEMYFNTSAAAGQNLYLCTASGWTQLTTSSGGGSSSGSGASSTSSLTDLQVQRSASTNMLTIGANCSASAPCNVRFGTRTFPFTSGATVTLSGTTANGTAYIYVTSTGTQATLTVGDSMGAVCSSACTEVPGILQFPPDSIPIATWTASNGVWDPAAAGFDLRAFLSNKSVIGGLGIITADVVGQTIVSVDTAVVGVQVAPPTASNAACLPGMYAFDANYFYQCIAASTWRRIAMSTF